MSSTHSYKEHWKKRQEMLRNDPRSTDELIALAVEEPDEQRRSDLVQILQARMGSEVLDAVRRLCASDSVDDRRLGVWIVGQNIVHFKHCLDDCVEILLGLSETEQSPVVLSNIGIAFGHLGDPRGIPALARLKNHPNRDVRYGVVHGLAGHEHLMAVSTLIELSSDPDTEVRDWATFNLGSQIDLNIPELRDALARRLTDEDDETRMEALIGLARRKDERVLAPLIAALQADSISCGTIASTSAILGSVKEEVR